MRTCAPNGQLAALASKSARSHTPWDTHLRMHNPLIKNLHRKSIGGKGPPLQAEIIFFSQRYDSKLFREAGVCALRLYPIESSWRVRDSVHVRVSFPVVKRFSISTDFFVHVQMTTHYGTSNHAGSWHKTGSVIKWLISSSSNVF